MNSFIFVFYLFIFFNFQPNLQISFLRKHKGQNQKLAAYKHLCSMEC